MYPKVAIIVLNFNGAAVLRKCLASLFKVRYPNLEIIVVDNNSEDGSLEDARKGFSRATYIKNEENIGFAAGNNVGIRFALDRLADYVLLLNNDTEVAENFLESLILLAEEDKTIGILSPLIFKGKTKEVWFSGGEIDWLKMKSGHRKELINQNYYQNDFITGCAMLVKKEVFSKIGLLDEDYFLYYEDADFSYRAVQSGFKLAVVAKSHVYHFEKSEDRKLNKLYWLVFSGLIFFKKNSALWLKPWIFSYRIMRRIKNKKDLAENPSEKAQIVRKAYLDFKLHGK